ncbi:MAG: hypothetical protein HW403_1087 [Dehalococcoidia bacterium]|nr:hypothetical protein [Dehalococcoidia bacterium]
MARMVRKQVYIEERQDALLKRRSKELGVSEAELVRRGIDEACRLPLVVPIDRQKVLEEMLTFIREHRMFDVPQTGRTWTRDEIYDERLDRLSH